MENTKRENVSENEIKPTVKFSGGGTMVWRAMSSACVGIVYRIIGQMNAKDCRHP